MPKEMTKSDKKKRRHEDEEPEDREKRKAAKKAEKVAKLLGYSNETNPFGDSNLLQPFVWGKKPVNKEEQKSGNSEKKRLELMDEINRVRKRREDREKELDEMERLRGEEMRLREAIAYGNWQDKEEEFHTEQIRVRSKIRLSEKREEPIDVLAKNILLLDKSRKAESSMGNSIELDASDIELRDPVEFVDSLNMGQLERLEEDIESYVQLSAKNKNEEFEKFWKSLKIVVQAILTDVAKASDSKVIHSSLSGDIDKLLKGKNEAELARLNEDIEFGLKDGTYSDAPYWEAVAREISIQRARNFVSEMHKSTLAKHLEILGDLKETLTSTNKSSTKNRGSRELAEGITSEEKQFLATEEDRGLENEEEKMVASDEVALPSSQYWWQDRYHPRKPRYFNRVRTGWDWNKYNQTHYDHDNPPPKTIQGYQFAIFYPDLIEKHEAPKYFLEGIPGETEFVLLRFHAGPPYEDVAFRIVNRAWDTHRKSGFRCVFDRGILNLKFNFMRAWYRR